MAEQTQILKAFVKLGSLIRKFCEKRNVEGTAFQKLESALVQAQRQNGWFTEENILFSLQQWGDILKEDKLQHWLSPYKISFNKEGKTVGIIMAGNIPLVGFHDFLCVLLTGHRVLCKLSSSDTILLPILVDYLLDFEPELQKRIQFTEHKLENFDAVIATGSNNTSRYFEYYFGKYPNIIRKNRTSVAVLTGNETVGQLHALGEDIFRYFGLGCRNVSKLFVPNDYDFKDFFEAIFDYKGLIEHHKYASNYDYNKAVYLMSEFSILDNGFLILKEEESLHSPIAALFYESYEDITSLNHRLGTEKDNIQCIVGNEGFIAFGNTQKPELKDYADGVDTVDFLLTL